jgi:glutamate synthase (ferredoxin)
MSHLPDHFHLRERDACGVAALADFRAGGSHALLERALATLINLSHRSATIRDEFGGETGDGAGILTEVPYALFAPWLAERGWQGEAGDYAVASLFLPRDMAAESQSIIEETLATVSIPVIGWREVPIDESIPGKRAQESQPLLAHLFVARPAGCPRGEAWERLCYIARKAAERRLAMIGYRGYFASFSPRTIVYKGMVTPAQLPRFYFDLTDPRYSTRVALTHARFSTNTTPTWERAQPYRRLCHNGEINTLQGNIAWMQAREALLPETSLPVLDLSGTDSAMLDNALEMLLLGGKGKTHPWLPHAMTMLMPPAWENDIELAEEQRRYHGSLAAIQEPWDGPAGLCFSDGRIVGATLDRNGLRPLRYDVTHEGWLIIASEAGAAHLHPREIAYHGRLGPGEMVIADVEGGYWLTNHALRTRLAREFTPVASVPTVATGMKADPGDTTPARDEETLTRQQATFGYTSEELQVILKVMAWDGTEAIGSMGDDTPNAILSQRVRPLAHYFKQRFAEVTNPAIDPLREREMMTLRTHLGPLPDPLQYPPLLRRVVLESPLLSIAQLSALEQGYLRSARLDATFGMESTLEEGLDNLLAEAEQTIGKGADLLIISDRAANEEQLPIPSLLAVSAVHHHLLNKGLRAKVSLISESGDARETHALAALIGFGANAVCPWLALESAIQLGSKEVRGVTLDGYVTTRNFLKAAEIGLLKIISKLGIGPIESYCGAQLFEAHGLSASLCQRYFPDMPVLHGNMGTAEVERDVRHLHAVAWGNPVELESPGFYKYKKAGEYHAYSPQVIHTLQKAVRTPGALNGHFAEGYAVYQQYSHLLHTAPASDPRDLLRMVEAEEELPLEMVEPATAIFRRFSTAAMSLGSLSREAHATLAIAMNRLGGLSNSGEGGEDSARFETEENSPIKQVASGRFGVTPAYLLSARELQIKIAQGSKPGEGGHLPGHKVTAEIAALRYTLPGVDLISPPPHHDIYSIEDLAQLIADLRAVAPAATISVKLVAQAGVGVIASGVVKAGADVVVISGNSGGTGASPLSSIKHAGAPWELGLAETQQILIEQRLRERVRLRVDGGFRTGRDVVIAALLGADEFSFGTAPLVAEGCLMARTCHKNNCPVGIATQREDLRAKFEGTPEHVMAFFTYIAQEVREHLARLGAASIDDIIGQTHLLDGITPTAGSAWLDVAPLLRQVALSGARRHNRAYHRISDTPTLDEQISSEVQNDLHTFGRSHRTYTISNRDRTIGAGVAGLLTTQYRDDALPADTVKLHLMGYAGQSFGAFALPAMTLTLDGIANDYVGKGLAGGTLIVRQPEGKGWQGATQLLGNVALYGATGGTLFAAGSAGERFAVRNSGATAVVEGVGAHGCEYMTGGTVVILGAVGRNFAAGMTGGRAFVFDPGEQLSGLLNREFVNLFPIGREEWNDLRTLVEEHAIRTRSLPTRRLLAEWESTYEAWRMVRPRRVAEVEAVKV